MAKPVIGLDLGSDSLRAVCLKGTSAKMQLLDVWVEKIGSSDANQDESLIAALKNLKKKFPRSGFLLAISLSAKDIMLQRLTFPFADPDKIFKVARFDVEPYIPFPIEQVFLDVQTLDTLNAGTEAQVLVAPRSGVEQKLALLKAAGLTADVVTFDGVALASASQALNDERSEPVLVLDIGAEKSSLHCIRDGRLLNSRSLGIAFEDRGLMSDEDASEFGGKIVRQINQSLQAWDLVRDAQKPEAVLLSGKPLGEKLENLLSMSLKGEVARFSLKSERLQGFDKLSARADPSRLNLALALAVSQINGVADREINFLKERSQAKGQRTLAGRLLRAGGIVLVLIVLFGGADLYVRTTTMERSVKLVKERINRTFRQVSPKTRRIVRPLAQMQEMVKKTEKRNRLLVKLLSDRSSGLSVLRNLSELIPIDLDVSFSDFLVDKDDVLISGETPNFEQVETLKKLISSSPDFTRVELLESRITPQGRRRVRFKLHLKVVEQE